MEVDVAIIGLGVMGSASLWRLAERGVKAIGFEQYDIPHNLGSSYGESRVIRTAYFEDPRYVPLIKESFHLWKELERVSGQHLLVMTGMLSIGQPNSEVIEGTLASVREHHLQHQLLDSDDMAKRYPQHRLGHGEVAVYEDDAGYLFPELSIESMVQRARDLGATAFTKSRVERIESLPGGIRIIVGGEEYRAQHAIVSVGTWLGTFLPELQLPVQPTRQPLVWWPVEHPDEYEPSRFPVYIHSAEGHNWYGFPTLDGRSIKMALHQEGQPVQPQTVDREMHPSDLVLPQHFVTTYLRGVVPRPSRSYVCMYTNTPDLHFLLGKPQGHDRITILGGFSGHGFKFASVLGDIAADFAVRGGTDRPIGMFDLDRFAAV